MIEQQWLQNFRCAKVCRLASAGNQTLITPAQMAAPESL